MTQPGKFACYESVADIKWWYVSRLGAKATKVSLDDLFIEDPDVSVMVPDHLLEEFEGFELIMGRRFNKINWNTNERMTLIFDYKDMVCIAYPIDPELIMKNSYLERVSFIMGGEYHTIDRRGLQLI